MSGVALKSYDNPVKRRIRKYWRDFVRKTVLKYYRPREVRVICLPGPEALEVFQVWDRLGVPRENIWAFERDPEAYRALKEKELGVRLFNMDVNEFFMEKEPDEGPFHVINLDYTGQFTWEVEMGMTMMFRKEFLAPRSVLLTTFVKAREGRKMRDRYAMEFYGTGWLAYYMAEDIRRCLREGVHTREEVEEIERLANQTVWAGIPVETVWMRRDEAEARYGFRLYQGGAVPGAEIRVVRIGEWDVEACGGTHCRNTSEVGLIKMVKTERIQDGVERLVFSVGPKALEHVHSVERLVLEASERLRTPVEELVKAVEKTLSETKSLRKEVERLRLEVARLRAREMFSKAEEIRRIKHAKGFLGEMSDVEEAVLVSSEVLKLAEVEGVQGTVSTVFARVGETARVVVMADRGAVEAGLRSRLKEMGEHFRVYGAFLGGRLVAYAYVVDLNGYAYISRFLAHAKYMRYAASNGLLSAVIEDLCERSVEVVQYGYWSRRHPGLDHFLRQHGFLAGRVEAYYVPLSGRGVAALRALRVLNAIANSRAGDALAALSLARVAYRALTSAA